MYYFDEVLEGRFGFVLASIFYAAFISSIIFIIWATVRQPRRSVGPGLVALGAWFIQFIPLVFFGMACVGGGCSHHLGIPELVIYSFGFLINVGILGFLYWNVARKPVDA